MCIRFCKCGYYHSQRLPLAFGGVSAPPSLKRALLKSYTLCQILPLKPLSLSLKHLLVPYLFGLTAREPTTLRSASKLYSLHVSKVLLAVLTALASWTLTLPLLLLSKTGLLTWTTASTCAWSLLRVPTSARS